MHLSFAELALSPNVPRKILRKIKKHDAYYQNYLLYCIDSNEILHSD